MYCLVCVRRLAAVAVLIIAAAEAAAHAVPYQNAVQEVLDGNHEVFHVDLQTRGHRPINGSEEGPWFAGFFGKDNVAAATVGHPIRRMLLHLREEQVEIEEALSWAEGPGKAADSLTFFRRGYQLVDNYLVRVLAGQAAWELPPGGVGKAELQAARVALGKFEVLLRADCLFVDLPLLQPYLSKTMTADKISVVASQMEAFLEEESSFLPLGAPGLMLLRLNRWDLQLWEFAHKLVSSRSTRLKGYLCGSSRAANGQRLPGKGKRAVVYNSPPYHLTGVAMFSCVLVSLGYDVTAVIKTPGEGYEDLLPCPHRVVTLDNNYIPEIRSGEILNAKVSAALGLPPWPREDEEAASAQNGDGKRRKGLAGSRGLAGEVGVEIREEGQGMAGAGKGERKGPFDLSVLCTIVADVNHVLKPTYPVDPRLVDALLWNVTASIWNLHSVEGAFRHGSRMPSTVNEFGRMAPSTTDGRTPPLTFLTLYGEHVELWERWSEEAYEGWGWGGSNVETEAAAIGDTDSGNSSFGALFRRPGVVYPIHPTGHLNLPRPKLPFQEDIGGTTGGGKGDVTFVVQGNMHSYRRDYKLLMRCLEAMCSSGRDNYRLVAVGARGDMPDEISSQPCVENRTTEWRHLGFPEFYANISAGHFVVTAAAGHEYEYDRATSTVPTALLLERPLVMSSTLLDAYPCLRRSRVHNMVANDDLCLNLEAAYDLSPAEYDEMELEARDCKLEMWRHARETVAGMGSGWTLD